MRGEGQGGGRGRVDTRAASPGGARTGAEPRDVGRTRQRGPRRWPGALPGICAQSLSVAQGKQVALAWQTVDPSHRVAHWQLPPQSLVRSTQKSAPFWQEPAAVA